jgi:GNAT superfamily N-acetyltransferase
VAIARVHVDVWRTAYRGVLPSPFLDSLSYAQREDLWRGVLAEPAGRHAFAAEELDGPVVGFALGGPARVAVAGCHGELQALYVLETHQRRGIGSALLTAVADALVSDGIDTMYAWVLTGNPALGFYTHVQGERLDERTIDVAGENVVEVAFGWRSLESQVLRREQRGSASA